MQNCTLYELKLADYAAGDLQQPDLGVVDTHLEICADCRAELAREMELRTVLGEMPTVACPDSVTQFFGDLLESDVQPSVQHNRANWWPAGLGLIAAALLAVLMVPGLLTGPPQPQQVATNDSDISLGFSAAEIAQARHDVIATLAMAAEILDRSRDNTVVNVFGSRLPEAITGSLRPLASDAQKTTNDPNQTHNGGNG